MSIPSKPGREQPSTYFVQDRASQEELSRLQVLDQMFTVGMEGVLSEQPDPTVFPHVLDVACGTGGWLIELAKTTPTCTRLVGIDVSRTFVEYARAQAEAAGVSDRVEFHVMDALRMLEFPDHSFDLVNHRSASSWLRTWDWPKLLQEYQRMVREGGVVRVTEPSWWVSASPALTRHSALSLQAAHRAGYFFTSTGEGVTSELVRLLELHGLHDVHTHTYHLHYRVGTPEWQYFFENLKFGMRTMVPFLRKWAHVPEDYEELCQQAQSEMQQPDFVANMSLLTAWGNVSPH
ncbi:MAG TPA: class I SAM-dependent methyltransferase [Ktedonobacteraceae bacterium]|jgi:ubiquinone/menaquinone biosynthesis C-methylase UbiE|nr:class I SAM-dependent methyltransferase [Ktedonobacteraceae bacterium]